MTAKNNRFQYQPWYIKLWRYRYYIKIPFIAGSMFIKCKTLRGHCYSVAKGLMQAKMNWVYDWDEIKK
jgi:hypothetical protein